MFLRLDSRYQQQDAGLSMPLLMLSLMLATERHVYADKATLRLMLLLISSLFLSSVLMLNFAKIKTVFTKLHMPWMGLMGPIYLQLSFEHWTLFVQFLYTFAICLWNAFLMETSIDAGLICSAEFAHPSEKCIDLVIFVLCTFLFRCVLASL